MQNKFPLHIMCVDLLINEFCKKRRLNASTKNKDSGQSVQADLGQNFLL